MGWDFGSEWKSPDDVRRYLLGVYGEQVKASGWGARANGEREFWIAYDHPEVGVIAFVALVGKSRRDGWWGYKLMDESMGPYYYEVPDNVWDAIQSTEPPNEMARDWRETVFEKRSDSRLGLK